MSLRGVGTFVILSPSTEFILSMVEVVRVNYVDESLSHTSLFFDDKEKREKEIIALDKTVIR